MIDQFLQRLDKVRKQGDDYYAVCPVGNHSGKRRTLSIKEVDGNFVIGQCFSCGAKIKDVAQVLGIRLGNADNKKPQIPYYPKDKRKLDRYLIDIVEEMTLKDRQAMLLSDKKAYREAKTRMDNFNEKMKLYMDVL